MTETQKHLCIELFLLGLILIFVSLYYSNLFIDNEGFVSIDSAYHTAFYQNVGLDILTEFKWLPFTIYATNFSDRHYLFHVILAIFSLVIPQNYAAFTYSVFSTAAVLYLMTFFVKDSRLINKLLLTITFFVSSPLIPLTFAQVRPISLMFVFTLLYLMFIRHKYLNIIISNDEAAKS